MNAKFVGNDVQNPSSYIVEEDQPEMDDLSHLE